MQTVELLLEHQSMSCMEFVDRIALVRRNVSTVTAMLPSKEASLSLLSGWQVHTDSTTWVSMSRSSSSSFRGSSVLPAMVLSSSMSRASCLLYTSDAADDLLCVDLGG